MCRDCHVPLDFVVKAQRETADGIEIELERFGRAVPALKPGDVIQFRRLEIATA